MVWDANELCWKPYTAKPTPLATPTEAAMDSLINALVTEYLGDDLVFCNNIYTEGKTEAQNVHKLAVFKALVDEELDPEAGTGTVLCRFRLQHPLYQERINTFTFVQVDYNGDKRIGLLCESTDNDRMAFCCKAADQSWWATRASVAWDLFGS